MDASPIYASAVGDSQTLWEFLCVATGIPSHYPCGCAFLRNASVGSLQILCKTKRRSQTPDDFLMSGSAESFTILICRPVADFAFS